MSPAEPAVKRAMVFIDGQKLFHTVREAFGYTYPSYDDQALAECLCAAPGWRLGQTRFYTGIPDAADNAFWPSFWERKLRVISWQGVHVYSRSLRYRDKTVRLPDGTECTFLAGEEKGIEGVGRDDRPARLAVYERTMKAAHRNAPADSSGQLPTHSG